jgi:CheY-like chemotaxis protein
LGTLAIGILRMKFLKNLSRFSAESVNSVNSSIMKQNDKQNFILVVDDNSNNLKVLADVLRAAGHRILVANSGESALEKLQQISPNLILLDVMMPGIDGFETCRRLKASETTRDIPVIFTTALSDAIDRVKGLELGAVAFKALQPDSRTRTTSGRAYSCPANCPQSTAKISNSASPK